MEAQSVPGHAGSVVAVTACKDNVEDDSTRQLSATDHQKPLTGLFSDVILVTADSSGSRCMLEVCVSPRYCAQPLLNILLFSFLHRS